MVGLESLGAGLKWVLQKCRLKEAVAVGQKFKHFFVYSHSHNMILSMIDNDKISIPKTVVDVGVRDDLPFASFVTSFCPFK